MGLWGLGMSFDIKTAFTGDVATSPGEDVLCMAVKRAPRVPLPLVILLAAAVCALLFHTPYAASQLFVVPDSEEYAIGAQRIATLGQFNIEINHVVFPSRYLPWFSLMMAPAYWLWPQIIGSGIVVVFLLSLAGVWASYKIGERCVNVCAGVAAALIFAYLLHRWNLTLRIVTDGPAAAMVMSGCLLYLMWPVHKMTLRRVVLVGVVVAVAVSLRSLFICMALPFAWGLLWRKKWRDAAVLFVPAMIIIGASALYQQLVFGDWRRTGYHYWCSVPYDFPELLLNWHNIGENIRKLLIAPVIVLVASSGAAAIYLLCGTCSGLCKKILFYIFLSCGPLVLFHQFYFWPDLRFFYPALMLLGLLPALAIGHALRHCSAWQMNSILTVLLIAALLGSLYTRHQHPEDTSRFDAAQMLAHVLPNDAWLVTGEDPVYFEPTVLRGTQREVIPMSRSVEYASKWVMPHRPQHVSPRPVNPTWHRNPALLTAGAREACPITLEDRGETILVALREGRPVYVYAWPGDMQNPSMVHLLNQCVLSVVEGSNLLYKLSLR